MCFGREPEPAAACGVCPWDEPVSAADAEIQSRVKKPSIAILPGASTSEDICPWESTTSDSLTSTEKMDKSSSEKSDKNLEVRSRKNSMQLDSGSSSSDISLAIVEVSDRLRRSCGLAQQQTLDGDKRGQTRKLSTASCVEVRRASVSLPTKFAESNRPSVSSFEEITSACEPVTISSDTDNNEESSVISRPVDNTAASQQRVLKKAQSLKKTSSISGANAPIISVSSVIDDVIIDADETEHKADDCICGVSNKRGGLEFGGVLNLQRGGSLDTKGRDSPPALAPLAVPDSESPCSEIAPILIPPQTTEHAEPIPETSKTAPKESANYSKDAVTAESTSNSTSATKEDLRGNPEGKQTDICPWEDE